MDKTVSAAAAAAGSATEVTVDVTFEPSSIGDTRASLQLSSSIGGEYTFPLFGVCLPPKPQVLFLLIDVTYNKSYDLAYVLHSVVHASNFDTVVLRTLVVHGDYSLF